MTAPSCFGDDVALTELSHDRYQATITDRWWIVIGPNGGLLAALILEAAVRSHQRDVDADADTVVTSEAVLAPRALTVQFLSSPTVGAVQLEVTRERVGRRVGVFTVRLLQRETLLALGRVTLARAQEPVFDVMDHVAPTVPPPRQAPITEMEPEPKNSRFRWECRRVFDGETVGGAPGLVSGGWLRLDPAEAINAAVLAAIADNWPPSLRGHIQDDRLHTITLEYHVYFRARALPLPPDEYALVLLRSASAIDGYHQEDAEIWSESGELLATARQLALVFRRND